MWKIEAYSIFLTLSLIKVFEISFLSFSLSLLTRDLSIQHKINSNICVYLQMQVRVLQILERS